MAKFASYPQLTNKLKLEFNSS